jgi:SH3-like domain-containing protein
MPSRFPFRPARATRQARLAALLAALLAAVLAAGLPGLAGAADGRVTGLEIPRFVSLRPDEVNLRAGPGLRYPIRWVYQRRNLPMEVIGEFKTWRQLRAWDGTEGWVHQAMIQGRRTARITGGEPRLLRRAPETGARPVAMLEPGVIADLEACRNAWCRLQVEGHAGWMPRDHFYGAYPGERLED